MNFTNRKATDRDLLHHNNATISHAQHVIITSQIPELYQTTSEVLCF